MARISVAEGMTDALARPGEPGYVPEHAEAVPEPPDPTPGPGPGQDSTPPPSSQESSAPADQPAPPPASALKPEHVEYATETLGVPAEEAEQMTKPELVELAKKAAPTLARSGDTTSE